METGQITALDSMDGEKLYQVRARVALPLLSRQAKAEQTITYSDLAAELGMPNPRNLNYVLGSIGNALLRLSDEWKIQIPPLQCVVVNKETRIPGEGFSWFLPNKELYIKSSLRQRRQMVNQLLAEVYQFTKWDDVLKAFNLQPAKSPITIEQETEHSSKGSGIGESEAHKLFKNYIAMNPHIIGISARARSTHIEYQFPSADSIDILFLSIREWIGVEAKTKKSGPDDITRGIFQCVKYQALIEASQMVAQIRPNARVVLALESEFPKELLWLKHILGIEVVDKIPFQSDMVPT